MVSVTNYVVSSLLYLLCLQCGEELIHSLGGGVEEGRGRSGGGYSQRQICIYSSCYLVDRGKFPVWSVFVLVKQLGMKLLIPTK